MNISADIQKTLSGEGQLPQAQVKEPRLTCYVIPRSLHKAQRNIFAKKAPPATQEDFRSCRGWKLMLDQEDLDFVYQAGVKGCDICL